jgi:4-alpha-glucanotransferase
MRESGILLHITSLPSPEGIGTLGAEARTFADFLEKAGMRIWQVLPISPTGYAESPYQSFSTFAGNALLIDLRTLKKQGILTTDELLKHAGNQELVDYPALIAFKARMLALAFEQSGKALAGKVKRFREENATWLEDYAFFMAIKRYFGNGSWQNWPDEDIRMRRPAAMSAYREKLKNEIDFEYFVQYLFFKQWFSLKRYVNERGISIFGDMPIYVAEDSADAWANPEIFQLDEQRRPTLIAGVPPDYFSADGQRWGNPLYDWAYLKKTRYAWWIGRLRAMSRIFDMTRVDHFIGFANFYSVPANEKTARNGIWLPGPGKPLFKEIKKELPDMRIIAEDLGAVTPMVKKLMLETGYPGMKVMNFAFSGDPHNEHLPKYHSRNSVVYTGTHDNNTLLGWWARCSIAERNTAILALGIRQDEDLTEAFLRATLTSAADTAILPMQDILRLGESARMNLPGTVGGNWLWRMKPGAAGKKLARQLRKLNEECGRT